MYNTSTVLGFDSPVEVLYTNFIPGKEFNKFSLFVGIFIGLIAFLIALWIDKKED